MEHACAWRKSVENFQSVLISNCWTENMNRILRPNEVRFQATNEKTSFLNL